MTKADVSPAMRKFEEFFALIHESPRPREQRLPVFSDRALKGLTMPVLAIVGAKDVLLDSADTRLRIDRILGIGDFRYIDDAGHFIPGQGTTVREFLSGGMSGTRSSTSRTG
jgi:pimeloyl-ACP methyl ester carboxylesterase